MSLHNFSSYVIILAFEMRYWKIVLCEFKWLYCIKFSISGAIFSNLLNTQFKGRKSSGSINLTIRFINKLSGVLALGL